jgi:SAM-dependent methyltransferase
VARLRVEDDALTGVELADGTAVPLDALAVSPRAFARADVLTGLGLETAEMRIEDHLVGTYVPADPTGATTMPGVWVAGNVADLMAQVGGAAAAGVRAGAAINADLIAEEVRTAVAARRAEGFWEEHYRGRERVGSGNPNPALVDVAGPLPAGTALDLGSGEGDDARWLAERGWRVTAVDVSATALERAGRHAAAAGVADRVDWQRHDLAESFPDGSFDLVSSHYLHSPVEFPRDRVLRAAAAAVAPGGLLLVVGHAEFPPWAHDHDHVRLPTPDDVLAALDLPPDRWKVELAERRERGATGPNGETGTLVDSVVAARRI